MKQGKRLGICTQPVTQLWERPEALEAADELLCGWIYEGLEEKRRLFACENPLWL